MAIKSNLDAIEAERGAIHTGIFKLPSAGRLYGKDFPETVAVQAFGFATEDVLIQPGSSLKKMLQIVQDVVTNFPPDFDHSKLLAGDVFAIIAVARSLTYGQDYKFKATCEACGTPEIITIKVPEQLPIISWENKTLDQLNGEWVVALPVARDSVTIRPLTIKEELALEDSRRIAKVSGSDDHPKVYEVAAHIRSVNGGEPDTIIEAVTYVRRLRGDDMTVLSKAISDCSPGINLGYDLMCDKCSHTYSTAIPLGSDFFRRNRV